MITLLLTGHNDRAFREAGLGLPQACLPMPGGGSVLEWVSAGLPEAAPGDRLYVVAPEACRFALALSMFAVSDRGRQTEVVLEREQTTSLGSALACSRWLRGREELLIVSTNYLLPEGALAAFLADMRRSASKGAGMAMLDRKEDRLDRVVAYWFRKAREFLHRARGFRERNDGLPTVVTGYKQYDVPLWSAWRVRETADLSRPDAYAAFVNAAPQAETVALVPAVVA